MAGAAQAELAAGLLAAVRAQDFGATADGWCGGAPVEAFPSIDLAVVDFAAAGGPRWANVLFSRELPHGHVAKIAADAGALRGLRFDADLRDAAGDSVAWLPGADWSRLAWTPLWAPPEPAPSPAPAGPAPGLVPAELRSPHARDAVPRFVAPYPASLLKLMVAVGVGLAVDRGLAGWPAALEPMIVVSDNDATDDCVALLHRAGLLTPAPDNPLNARFAAWGLPTLRLDATTARGGWRNADGAGVGRIHMTAWDSVRLLWLLDPAAPPAPWLPPGTPTLADATRRHLHAVLARQQLDEILSSGALRGLPGWVPGLPDAPVFAHKTGTTDNYASDAGIVHDAHRHYLVSALTNLGRRYAPVMPVSTAPGTAARSPATTWRLPALGAAIDALLRPPGLAAG